MADKAFRDVYTQALKGDAAHFTQPTKTLDNAQLSEIGEALDEVDEHHGLKVHRIKGDRIYTDNNGETWTNADRYTAATEVIKSKRR